MRVLTVLLMNNVAWMWFGLGWYWYVQHLKPSGFIPLLVYLFLSSVSGNYLAWLFPFVYYSLGHLDLFFIHFEARVHNFFPFTSFLGILPGYFPGFLFLFPSFTFLPSCATVLFLTHSWAGMTILDIIPRWMI